MSESTGTPRTNAKRIIVGVDGSESSIGALVRAAEIAAALDLPIEAITVWDYEVMLDAYYPVTDWSPRGDAEKRLATAVERAFGSEPPSMLTQTALRGRAAQVLIEESRGARMLVVGSRGRGGFAGLFLGSTSSACAAHAHCPVLVMHMRKATSTSPTSE